MTPDEIRAERRRLHDELAANNQHYLAGDITRAEWVAANRLLNEDGAKVGMTLPPVALTDREEEQ